MMFGVPTMYHRLAEDAEAQRDVAEVLSGARLLVSGSAALPAADHERIARATGQQIVERYGMTETLMNTSVRASEERRPGYVGPPLTGVELDLIDDDGEPIETSDDEMIGEVRVRGPNLFTEYLNRPDATADAARDGWFFTGDLATRTPDGYIRIVGRRSTDLIKSGGYKIGAGEIEMVLLGHPAVADVAVTGEADPDLGERIIAWVVPASGTSPSEDELANHVAQLLAPHKRPRDVRFVDELPRNEMGKVMKKALQACVGGDCSLSVGHEHCRFPDCRRPAGGGRKRGRVGVPPSGPRCVRGARQPRRDRPGRGLGDSLQNDRAGARARGFAGGCVMGAQAIWDRRRSGARAHLGGSGAAGVRRSAGRGRRARAASTSGAGAGGSAGRSPASISVHRQPEGVGA